MTHQFPYKLIDLTHTLSDKAPSWDGGCGFHHDIKLDYDECDSEVKFRVQQIKMHAGIGTHIDSPSHCIPGATTVDSIPLDRLIAPLVVIDVHEKMTQDYTVSVDDIHHFEKQHGHIQPDCFVAFYTGWSQHWGNPLKYHNNHVFPSICELAANLLISRKIVGLGIDTLSPDRPNSGFPVHHTILGNHKYIVENVAHLQKMPPTGACVLILPIKGSRLTEAPVRMIGLIRHGD